MVDNTAFKLWAWVGDPNEYGVVAEAWTIRRLSWTRAPLPEDFKMVFHGPQGQILGVRPLRGHELDGIERARRRRTPGDGVCSHLSRAHHDDIVKRLIVIAEAEAQTD